MEWIETTGRSIEEAKEAALDELGVDEQDAEFEVLAEPKVGLFGRMRVEARVRSRVRPTAPRAKEDRRHRRRGPKTAGSATDEPTIDGAGAASATAEVAEAVAATAGATARSSAGGSARRRGNGARAEAKTGAQPARGPRRGDEQNEGKDQTMGIVEVSLEEQGRVAQEFLSGLVQEFGLQADITATIHEEDVIELAVSGDNLGLLIGPKGATLLALQDLTRSAVQQKTSAGNGRINVDVSGYRQKRSEALARFALQVAEKVKETGERQALEPMSAVDRKVVHDALTDVEGVQTISEGEDTFRRVVVLPATA